MDPSLKKKDAELIVFVMARLPVEPYDPFKSGIKIDQEKFSKFTIYKFCDEIKQWYEDNVEPRKKQTEENLNLQKGKKYCSICKKDNHEDKDCFFKNSRKGEGRGQEKRKCFYCDKVDYIKVSCCKLIKDKEEGQVDCLFVGNTETLTSLEDSCLTIQQLKMTVTNP